MYQPITGNGTGAAPVVSVTFPYLDRGHVHASVNGLEVPFTWTGASQITFNSAVPSGSSWSVYRDTSIAESLVDYTDGAVLTEADLDKANTQHQYLAQELAAKLVLQGADNSALAQALQQNIDDEASARSAADATLQASLDEILPSANAAAAQAADAADAAAASASQASGDANDAALSAAQASNALNAVQAASGTIIQGLGGGNDEAIIEAAFTNASEGDVLVFPRGGVSTIGSLMTLRIPGVHVIADGHTFNYTADGAGLRFIGPVSDVMNFTQDYVAGSRDLTIAHSGTQLSVLTEGTWIKVISNALDGWQRNSGANPSQYRLAEWGLIRKITDNGDGTAKLTLWSPLKFILGFAPTELITNGAFTTDASGWTAINATMAIVSQRLRVANTAAATGYAYQSFPTVVGRTYRIKSNAFAGTAGSWRVRVGTAAGSSDILNLVSESLTDSSFVATSTTTFVSLVVNSVSVGAYVDFDNISVEDYENTVEVQTYTVSAGARIIGVLSDTMRWDGGTFLYQDAASHISGTGWNSTGLLELRGYVKPRVNNTNLGPGVGRGLFITGCVNFEVNSPHIRDLPDNSELSANDGVSTSYLGYGILIAGGWGGTINNMVARNTRHAITEGATKSLVNDTGDILMSVGRTYGTRINSPTSEGQYSATIDTHHGAHGWIISNPTVLGTEEAHGIDLRGPDHVVIGGQITGNRGIQVFSEFADNGSPDLPGLVGNGDEWMSSARLIGVNLDVTHEALRAGVSTVTIEGGMKVRSRTHNVFTLDGGVVELASGRVDVKITGEQQASAVNGETTTTGIVSVSKPDPAYGVTWTPEFLIRDGVTFVVDATDATDATTMAVFDQDDDGLNGLISIHGAALIQLPPSGFSSTVFRNVNVAGSMAWGIGPAATLEIVGDPAIEARYPKWAHGKTKIQSLAPSTARTLFTFHDGLGGADQFVARVKVLVVQSSGPALVAEYQIQDTYADGGSTETTYLLSGSTTDFEANSNVDLSATAPTVGKIGLSLKDGAVQIRSEKSGITYDDVFAEFVILRQPLVASE